MTNGEPRVHRSAAAGFGREADSYSSARPGYHPSLVERFVNRYGSEPVLELGAGTGIFTQQLVQAGCRPIASEPVEAMRDLLVENCPEIEVIAGTAEATGASPNSIRTVVAAQAFHWFDYEKALNEIPRVLVPDGWLVCVWNVRDETVPWVAQYTEIVDRHADDTPRHRTMHWRAAIDRHPKFELVDDWSIANPQPTSPSGVVERARSTSFIAALSDDEQADVLAAIRRLVEPLGSHFEFPYRSELQAWRHV